MKRTKRKKLLISDFAGDGEPYTEVEVTISIRILRNVINRSRLVVNIHPEPALEKMVKKSLPGGNYGFNQDGVLSVCLSEHFNGWEDMNRDFPALDEKCKDQHRNCDSARMNQYIAKSVEWALVLHRKGMAEAEQDEPGPTPPSSIIM